ncbi:MAG: 50S ribosomal protein L28 [Candidatus Gracilibacteria bacterium]
MSKVCQLTGARPRSGHKVSHSNKKSNRRFLPNLVKKTVIDAKTGEKVSLKITARALRTLAKNPKKFADQIHAFAKKSLKKKLK